MDEKRRDQTNKRLSIKIDDKTNISNIEKVKISFGPHHFCNITKDEEDIYFEVGFTHHGVKFKASQVDGELYKVIDKIRKEYPNNKTD